MNTMGVMRMEREWHGDSQIISLEKSIQLFLTVTCVISSINY